MKYSKLQNGSDIRGVAMENSCPEALAAADIITLSNAEDGVAKTIRENCL